MMQQYPQVNRHILLLIEAISVSQIEYKLTNKDYFFNNETEQSKYTR